MRETLCLELAAGLVFKLGNKLVEHLDVISVPHAVHDEKSAAVGLFQKIFYFGDFIVGVDRHQDGADSGRGKLKGYPMGNIGGPDANFVAFCDAESHEALCQQVDLDGKFLPGQAVVPVGIHHRIVIRHLRNGGVEGLPDGEIAGVREARGGLAHGNGVCKRSRAGSGARGRACGKKGIAHDDSPEVRLKRLKDNGIDRSGFSGGSADEMGNYGVIVHGVAALESKSLFTVLEDDLA